MIQKKIKIGTRGSKLAIWQAQAVKSELEIAFPNISVDIVVIKTKGDIILDVALSKIGDKGLFTKEIETALINNEVDIAVHSLKDLPTELPEGLIVGAVLPRADVRDVLISKDGLLLNQLTANHRIATSSLRRRAQLLHFNPDFNIVDIRGNVDSRINKMHDGVCDALIMAGAGILRLGYENIITEFLSPDIMLPATAQGAVAIEMREDDDDIMDVLSAINHQETWSMVMAERSFLRTMEGGCQVPVACFSSIENNVFSLTGLVASLDGKTVIKSTINSLVEEAPEKAVELAIDILSRGGSEILNQIRN